MFIKQKDQNYVGETDSQFREDNLVGCLAQIINERQTYSNRHGIPLYFPGDILYDMEFIQFYKHTKYMIQVCECGTQTSWLMEEERIKAQWRCYTCGHKLVGIFILRKKDEDWNIEELDVNEFINKFIGEED